MKTVVKHRELNLALGENLEAGMAGRGRLKSGGTYVYSMDDSCRCMAGANATL